MQVKQNHIPKPPGIDGLAWPWIVASKCMPSHPELWPEPSPLLMNLSQHRSLRHSSTQPPESCREELSFQKLMAFSPNEAIQENDFKN